MTTRTASCSCGQLRVRCEGDPVRVSVCHCLACQQRTGSAFGVQARFPRDQVQHEGQSSVFYRNGDSGGEARLRFCPKCGTTLWWDLDGLPDFISVAVGAFTDPTFPAPTISVYEARAHSWSTVPTQDHMD